MGKRGPKPEPSELKRRRGNPGKRALNDQEPLPDLGMPPAPEWLGDGPREHWGTIAPILHDMGVLTVADGVALALLCDALVDFLHAAAIVKEEGCIARTDKGVLFQHPAVGVKNKAWERVVKVLREFGMTPTSRPGIHATGKREKGDPKDKFFKPRLGVVG